MYITTFKKGHEPEENILRGNDAGHTSLYWHDSEEVYYIAPLEIEIGRYVGLPAEQRTYCVEEHYAYPALLLPHIPCTSSMDFTTPGIKDIISNYVMNTH